MKEHPIPASLAGQLEGWSAKAQQYPVFSRTWYAYRVRSFAWPCIFFTVFLLLGGALTPAGLGGLRFWLATAAIWTLVVVALLLGRWLAVQVCQRGWPPSMEASAVVLSILGGMAVAGCLAPYTRLQNDPRDYWINGLVWGCLLL